MWIHSLLLVLFLFENTYYPQAASPFINYGRQISKRKLLLVTLDGFRHDFASKYRLQNLIQLMSSGVTAEDNMNVFPTNTLPNHQSIITGRYPENHGIIDNRMYDILSGEKFEPNSLDSHWWNQSTPLWVTNQKAGGKSIVYDWPGGLVKYNGTKSTVFKKTGNNCSAVFEDTMRILAKDFNFAAVHIDLPDEAIHDMGLNDANEVNKILHKVDHCVEEMLRQLQRYQLQNLVNVIVIGDHGVTSATKDKMIHLSDYLPMEKHVKYVTGFTNVFLYPKDGHECVVYKYLHNAHPNMTVYLKKDLPDRFHIRKNNNTAPILLLPDLGWTINTTIEDISYLHSNFSRGEHGYDNSALEMHPGFGAVGSVFKRNYKIGRIETVDLYDIMCCILNLKPEQNDGKFERIKGILSDRFRYECELLLTSNL